MHRSWVEISRNAIEHNVRALRTLIGSERVLIAVVKANAYGHGILEVANVIRRERAFFCGGLVLRRPGEGGGWFGVDSVPEALALRDAGIVEPIIVLGYVSIAEVRQVIRARLRITIASIETARALAATARSLRRRALVHVKLETGTHRQGVPARDLPDFLRALRRMPALTVEGASTHLADVEDTGPEGFAAAQLATFDRMSRVVERMVGAPILRHASASSGAMAFTKGRYDAVRCGIALYGLWPSDRMRDLLGRRDPNFILRPVLTWKTIVGPLHRVPMGAAVGYGCTERVTRSTRIAVLPVGYWDGYDRKLSSNAEVLIGGRRRKVIGRICMNMCMVDVTDAPRVRLEDEVVLIGSQGRSAVTADELASRAGTINYEFVTRINPLIARKVL